MCFALVKELNMLEMKPLFVCEHSVKPDACQATSLDKLVAVHKQIVKHNFLFIFHNLI